MSFRSVFIAVVISFGLVLAGYLVNRQRPAVETDQPGEAFVKATGKCAECHIRQHYSVVHEYECDLGEKGPFGKAARKLKANDGSLAAKVALAVLTERAITAR